MSVVDFLQGEYGASLHEAVFAYPLPAAIALWPAAIRRHGGEVAGPDTGDRAAARAMARAKAWLQETFEILPRGIDGPPNALAAWLQTRPDDAGKGARDGH